MIDLTLYPNIYKYGINKDIVWYETYWGTKNSWFVNDVTVFFNHKNSYLQIDNSSINITWDIKSDLLFEIINTLISNDNYDINDKDILIKPLNYVFNDIIYDFNNHNIADIFPYWKTDCKKAINIGILGFFDDDIKSEYLKYY